MLPAIYGGSVNREPEQTMMDATTRGFTLIELMVTLAIATILLTIAVPNFVVFVQNNRLTSQANDLVTALNYARSEAIKGGAPVTVCGRASNTACGGATTWDAGYLVYADTNRNGAPDAGEILQVRQQLEGGNSLRAGASTQITYQSSGFRSDGNGPDTFSLYDSRGVGSGRAVCVNTQGRTLVIPGSAACP